MTVVEMSKLVGKQGSVGMNGLRVAVTITDVKQSYGIVRVAVSPVAGTGSAWVEASRVVVS